MAILDFVHVLSGHLEGSIFGYNFDAAFEIRIENGGGIMKTSLGYFGVMKMENTAVFEFGIVFVVVIEKGRVLNLNGTE